MSRKTLTLPHASPASEADARGKAHHPSNNEDSQAEALSEAELPPSAAKEMGATMRSGVPVEGVGDLIAEDVPAPRARRKNQWWGQYGIEEEQQGTWRVGPLQMQLQRLRHEWRLATTNAPEQAFDPNDPVDIGSPTAITALPPDTSYRRYGFNATSEAVRLSPLLADRPVVTKTDRPLYVFAGEEVTIYISFPIWVRVGVGEPQRGLHEAPVFQLSDTWFGPATEGELCYASRTFGQLDLKAVPMRPYRAIGAVTVRNHAGDALLIEKLKTPCPLLSLYQDEAGMLWTDTQVVERTLLDEGVRFEVQHAPPTQAAGAQLVTGPRRQKHKSVFQRAFSSFVG